MQWRLRLARLGVLVAGTAQTVSAYDLIGVEAVDAAVAGAYSYVRATCVQGTSRAQCQEALFTFGNLLSDPVIAAAVASNVDLLARLETALAGARFELVVAIGASNPTIVTAEVIDAFVADSAADNEDKTQGIAPQSNLNDDTDGEETGPLVSDDPTPLTF